MRRVPLMGGTLVPEGPSGRLVGDGKWRGWGLVGALPPHGDFGFVPTGKPI